MIRSVAAAAASLAFAVGTAFAQGTDGAESFVKELVAELRTQAETHGEGSKEVRDELQANLAAEDIGKFLLAGDAAKGASEAERGRYDELFPSYIAAAYADEIGQLTAREIEVKQSLERRPGDYIVQSVLRDKEGRARADIDWRVREKDGEYKLLDVLVERTSPLITRRQAFSSRVRDGGVAGLLTHMEEVIAASAAVN
ncbi:MlaC/ttg2D family ABC transporter substrate-binding protein [Parvularcula maris]|uniref:ABC transporter substrate-binding protein n=1 Tax=Parvularcula maris TaxID=2965077 RepID=A0A9X2L6E1_9PROT|nr:ABC transporter substrate-binding protein [Parvularcula maris]MCQ8183791.1 ABC transporter substrate-binding protein [Parvularcula maris]